MHSTRTPAKPAPVNANVMCVMAQNQDHRDRSRVEGQLRVLEFSGAGCSGLVPGNKKSAGFEAVDFSAALQAVSILLTGKDQVVVVPAAGFVRATGGRLNRTGASHITNRSSSFRPSASTGRAKARRLA